MDLNTAFRKYGNNRLWQTASLKMAQIVMLLKVTNNMIVIAIHHNNVKTIALGEVVFEIL